MKYIDTGSRNQTQSLAAWLQGVMSSPVAEVRWQSGYFGEEPLALFGTTLQALAASGGLVRVLIGSNAPGTRRDDVLRLVQMIGLPRTNGQLGVVQYGNAFFHPKVFHFRRADGSQCAYVGSANLTAPGVSSLHVEAGLTLDTRENDPAAVLTDIANAIDGWFAQSRSGLNLVTTPADVTNLTTAGVLVVAPPPPPPAPPAVAGAAGSPPGSTSPHLAAPDRTFTPSPAPATHHTFHRHGPAASGRPRDLAAADAGRGARPQRHQAHPRRAADGGGQRLAVLLPRKELHGLLPALHNPRRGHLRQVVL